MLLLVGWASSATDEDGTCKTSPGTRTEVLSFAPRIYLHHGFINDSQLNHLRRLTKELGVFKEAPKDPHDKQDARGYNQRYLDDSYYEDPVILDLEKRIGMLSHIPFEPGSGATLSLSVRNATGDPGMTNLHHDHNAAALALMEHARRGHKLPLTEMRATLLGYLADVEKGGETIFPCVCNVSKKSCLKAQVACQFLYEKGVFNVHPKGHNTPFALRPLEEQAMGRVKKAAKLLVDRSVKLCSGKLDDGLRVVPRAGQALLFFSNTVRGQADPRAWHGSCRVVAGQKLATQRFLYAPQNQEETGDHARARFTW